MCGIAGVIHRDGSGAVGREMRDMLQALRHRGPDSTGFGLYGTPADDVYIIRLKIAEQADLGSRKGGLRMRERIRERRAAVDARLRELGVDLVGADAATEYVLRYAFRYDGNFANLADLIEDIDGVEILSAGHALELIKDLGDAEAIAARYSLDSFTGTHAIGHTRMATESDVDIRSAHPYWAYPFNDISVVHNGQLTNYWSKRRAMERQGHRFLSNCDSELIAVYVADHLERGVALEDTLRRSVDELDGVFTYLVATRDQLGMAKDTMAAKPLVLYEDDDLVALASEEVAIRSILPGEIDTTDPYDGEVKVWQV